MVTTTKATAETELIDTGEQRDALGRRRTPRERRMELLAAYRTSGLTQRAFARREGVNYTTFCTSAQAERRSGRLPAAPAGRKARRRVVAGEAARLPFVEVQLPAAASGLAGLEVRLADGTLLRGGDATELAKLDRAQLILQLGELEKLVALPTEKIVYECARGPAPKRTLPAESFAHLPVKETVEIVPEPVRADPDLYERIGEERTFEVDVIPPQLFKREIVRPKYRHRLDRSRAPLLAPAPPRVVVGGFASAGLIAWALTAKFCDHLPLYRQEKMLARWGAPISRQNLCDWVGAATALLEPLVKRMKQDLLQGGYVQVDETPIRCNDPDLRDGKTTQGWLWALSRPGGDVVFEWRLSRRHEEAGRLLGDYRGVLQSDGYEAYAAYARTHPGVEWAGCWAHARRRFFEAAAERPRTAERVLRLIGRLYVLEREWDDAHVGDRRAALRQAHFAQPLARLRRLVTALRARVLPKSGLGQACAYLLGHWAPLTVHLRHSHTQIDTNAVENAIRPSKLGAKNWLFVGHPATGDRPAVLYSLVVSCQRHGLDPHAYLKDVLARLPAMTTTDDLRPMLPSRWQPPTLPAS